MKRFISMMLVIIMVLSMGVAFAEQPLVPIVPVAEANAQVAVERAEETKLQADVTEAYRLVNLMVAGPVKNEFIDRLNFVQRGINIVIRDAKCAVAKAKDTKKASDKADARYCVSLLEPSRLKSELTWQLDDLETLEDGIALRLAKAIAAVEKAELTKLQRDVDIAGDLVYYVDEYNDRRDLEYRLDAVQDEIDQRETAEDFIVAERNVKLAEKYRTQKDVDFARYSIERLPSGRARARLIARLEIVQDEITEAAKPVEATEAEVRAYLSGLNLVVSPWAEKVVYNASKDGLLSSTNLERNSDLRANISREDFVEIIMNHIYVSVTPEKIDILLAIMPKMYFSDTTNFKITQAAQLGIVNGMGDGTFGPKNNITREQMAVILDRVNKLVGGNATDVNAEVALRIFADAPMISDWARQAVANQVVLGTIEGMGNGMFAPSGNATREQAIKILISK